MGKFSKSTPCILNGTDAVLPREASCFVLRLSELSEWCMPGGGTAAVEELSGTSRTWRKFVTYQMLMADKHHVSVVWGPRLEVNIKTNTVINRLFDVSI